MSVLLSPSEIKNPYYLARKRRYYSNDYYQFQKFQGGLLVRYLDNHGDFYLNHLTLDMGCAFGGYTQSLKEKGALVIGLDLQIRYKNMQMRPLLDLMP